MHDLWVAERLGGLRIVHEIIPGFRFAVICK